MENKSKNNLKIVIILIIVLSILAGLILIWHNVRNQNSENIEELKDFDITVSSYVDFMPTMEENDEPKEANFIFTLKRIDKNTFLNDYAIESIELNGSLINVTDINYDSRNGFSFYSSNYDSLNNNTINLIITNKNTNTKYVKKIKVSTNIVV